MNRSDPTGTGIGTILRGVDNTRLDPEAARRAPCQGNKKVPGRGLF